MSANADEFIIDLTGSEECRTRSRKMHNISPISGLDMMVEDSSMESEDTVFGANAIGGVGLAGTEPQPQDPIALLGRCGDVLQEIYALGLEEEIEGEHINVILRELIDVIDSTIASEEQEGEVS